MTAPLENTRPMVVMEANSVLDSTTSGNLHYLFPFHYLLDITLVFRDQGIESELSYPYEMYDDICKADSSLVVTNIQGYANVESRDEDALLAAVGLIGENIISNSLRIIFL